MTHVRQEFILGAQGTLHFGIGHAQGFKRIFAFGIIEQCGATGKIFMVLIKYGGGTDEDGFYNAAVMATSDGGLLIGGDSSSGATGNKALPGLGGRDYWVLKLDQVTPPTLFAPVQISIAQNGFGLLLQGQLDKSYVTEYSSDLIAWFPLTTNRLTISPTAINDSSAKSVSHRFYRARELP